VSLARFCLLCGLLIAATAYAEQEVDSPFAPSNGGIERSFAPATRDFDRALAPANRDFDRALAPAATTDGLVAQALPDLLELVESVPLETEASLDDPDIRSTQEVWLEMVESARETLDMEFFYLRHQPKTGLEPVVQAVERAHQRGVKIRVLLDAKFLLTYPELASRWSQMGIEVRTAKFESGVQHTKLLVVDQRQVFLGSQNFDWTALSHIRELGVHVQQPALAQAYAQAFEHDWRRAVGERISTAPSVDRKNPVRINAYGGEVEIYPVFSPAQPEWSHGSSEEEALVQLLRSAQKTIELQVMSYSPVVVSHPGDGELPRRYETLDIELRAAAARGVEVRLLISDWGNKPPHKGALQALATVPHIQIQVSCIPPWSGGEIPFSRVAIANTWWWIRLVAGWAPPTGNTATSAPVATWAWCLTAPPWPEGFTIFFPATGMDPT